MTEATERDELRELLFDGVAPPPDTDAMFERTFAATGDDGAHLLPPDDLFDAGDPADEPPLDDAAPDGDGGSLLDDGAYDLGDGAPDDIVDPGADWSEPADVTEADPGADAGPADAPYDHPTSGW